MRARTFSAWGLGLLMSSASVACGGDGAAPGVGAAEGTGAASGTSGSAGAGGGSGTSGSAGTGGTAGASGAAGTSGSGGAGDAGALSAVDDVGTTTRGVTVVFDVRANDGAAASAVITGFTSGTQGEVRLRSDGRLEYVARDDADGADTFTYTLRDGALSATATVSVDVIPRLGTVSGGRLYQARESAQLADATPDELAKGFFWYSANGKGDAVGRYAKGRMFVRFADGTATPITLPPELPTVGQGDQYGDFCPAGINERGDVVGFWFDPNFTSKGWLWTRSTGGVSVWDDTSLAKHTPADLRDDGTVVGYFEDYDDGKPWLSFARPVGQAPSALSLFGASAFTHTVVHEITEAGVVAGNVSSAGDGLGAPAQCFTRRLPDGPYDVKPNPAGVYSVDCRGANEALELVGKLQRVETSRMRGFRWTPAGLHEVRLPFASARGATKRAEEIMAIANDGKLFANILDLAGGFRAVELTPVAASPGVSHLESTFDYVGELE
jgi:hypothetical protein